MNKTKKQLAQVSALVLALTFAGVLSGCQQSTSAPEPSARNEQTVREILAKPCPVNIVKVAVLQDKTGSTSQTRTPQMSMKNIEDLVDFIRPCGGEIGFGLINEQSNASLHRLRIDTRPSGQPKEPDHDGNPIMAQREMEKYRKAKESYAERVLAWWSESDKKIQAFKEEIKPLLTQEANAPRSDFFGGIQRANLFLQESSISWAQPTVGVLLIVGDGIDNVGARYDVLDKATVVILVNGSASVGSLAPMNPTRFENIDSGIRHIIASEIKPTQQSTEIALQASR